MSFNNHFFGYNDAYTADNSSDDEFTYWNQYQQPHLVPMSSSTVDPYHTYHQPSTYHSVRNHNSEQRYNSANRHNVCVTPGMEPIVIQQTLPTAQTQRFNTYNAEREVRQRPAVMVEVRTQPARSSTRYYCEFEGCRDPTTGKRRSLSRRADLRRHVLSMHGGPTIDCEYKKCIRKGDDGFCREDHYREHLRGYHCQELPPRKTTRRNS